MIGKIIGYEVNQVKKVVDGEEKINEYRYIHVVWAESVEGVTGTAVARLALDYQFKIDLKTIKLGAEYEIFKYFDTNFHVNKCNGLLDVKR